MSFMRIPLYEIEFVFDISFISLYSFWGTDQY